MTNIFRFPSCDRSEPAVYFRREDLRQIMDVFSRKVLANEWRDYAIDQGDGRATFCIYRHAHDVPLFRIVKLSGRNDEPAYLVINGHQKVRQCATLKEALKVFDRSLTAV